MKTHIVIDGNAFYEVDEECMERKKEEYERKGRSIRTETGKVRETKHDKITNR